METAVRVITIPAKPPEEQQACRQRLKRVAAYCRVSTDDKDQLSSYEAQKNYYTDYIMKNAEWTMAGLFADEGITGTQAKKRPEFIRMIRHCRQKKIDLILVKSISRFARNTVECISYTRALRALGIGVFFEEQNINSINPDSEFLITLHGAIAQNESENISKNVAWGMRQAMRDGKAAIQYKKLYAYEKCENGKPKIIPEEAEVVRRIYREYLAGGSLRQIVAGLETDHIPSPTEKGWSISAIRNILTNEKYAGDVIRQKTFVADPISKRVVKNTGQLPMYLLENHHEGIVDKATHNAVQAEWARRNAKRTPSTKTAPTGKGCYASKFALSERLICGECGSYYRRCTWSKKGKKRIVWRCVSRLDYGTKYCHDSPTLDESVIQRAILIALNSAMGRKDELVHHITDAMAQELISIPGEAMSLADIERRLEEINQETHAIVVKSSRRDDKYESFTEQLKALVDESAALKERRAFIQEQQQNNTQAIQRIESAKTILEQASPEITEWDDSVIRQLVESVKVLSAEKLEIRIRGGSVIQQDMIK
jgi:DNA invertase Pin-like site-specific DNA recombinase